MPPAKRKLDSPVRRMNPYANTIDEAMQRLAGIEAAVLKTVQEASLSRPRIESAQRAVIRKGYLAGTNPTVGLMWENSTAHDLILKRINLIFPTVSTAEIPWALYVGSASPQGLREVGVTLSDPTVANALAVTFGDGSTGQVYSDSFSNDIYVRSREPMYIRAASNADISILAILEVERLQPYRTRISEDEAYAISGTPLPPSSAQAAAVNITADPDAFERHEQALDIEPLMEGTLDVDPPPTIGGGGLLPDVTAHLPEHLR